MPWHLDEQMYASPQWELIYTIANTSDSRWGPLDTVKRHKSKAMQEQITIRRVWGVGSQP